MATARGRSGSGVAVALVIFIVLTLVGIGAAIWFLQQYSILKKAVAANQKAFQTSVASVFQERDWDITRQVGAEYGFEYDEKAYDDVAGQLKAAIENEKLMPVLGWENLSAVQSALDLSPVQEEADAYATMQGLLGFYEGEYKRLTERTSELENAVRHGRELIADKTAKLTEVQERLGRELNEAEAKHTAALADLTKQFDEMKAMYEQARNEVREWQGNYDAAQGKWEAAAAELRKEADGWKELYDKITGGEEIGKKMVAAGKVLGIAPGYDFVMLEGGEDRGLKKNDKFVVYSEFAAGVQTRKGEVHVSNVYRTTALATVFNQKEQILDADLFVSVATWEKFHPPAPMEVAEAEEAVPFVGPIPAEPEEPEAPPAEIEEEVKEFIFEF